MNSIIQSGAATNSTANPGAYPLPTKAKPGASLSPATATPDSPVARMPVDSMHRTPEPRPNRAAVQVPVEFINPHAQLIKGASAAGGLALGMAAGFALMGGGLPALAVGLGMGLFGASMALLGAHAVVEGAPSFSRGPKDALAHWGPKQRTMGLVMMGASAVLTTVALPLLVPAVFGIGSAALIGGCVSVMAAPLGLLWTKKP